jgi:hypothetical protein
MFRRTVKNPRRPIAKTLLFPVINVAMPAVFQPHFPKQDERLDPQGGAVQARRIAAPEGGKRGLATLDVMATAKCVRHRMQRL